MHQTTTGCDFFRRRLWACSSVAVAQLSRCCLRKCRVYNSTRGGSEIPTFPFCPVAGAASCKTWTLVFRLFIFYFPMKPQVLICTIDWTSLWTFDYASKCDNTTTITAAKTKSKSNFKCFGHLDVGQELQLVRMSALSSENYTRKYKANMLRIVGGRGLNP